MAMCRPSYLTAQDGQPFHSQALAGKIWVADFMYTTCPGPCPRMTSQMHDVQQAVLKVPDVHLVSFTVDPKNDTPAVLADYAKVHGASPAMWNFLTGPVATLQMLDRDVFKLGNVDGTLAHSTRFVLVDRQGAHSRLLRDLGPVFDSQADLGHSRFGSGPHLIDVHALPAVNATLNGTAAVLLAIGYVLIRQKRIDAHRRVMLTAFGVSVVFLTCYLIYHFNAGVVYYQKTGLIRGVYLTILTTHTILAVTVPVLAIITLRRGLRMNVERHRAIARWTLPIWMYVSVTGVVVYLMLYRF